MSRRVLAGAILLTCLTSAKAVDLELGLAYEVGGENLVDESYTNGDPATIAAGDGVLFSAGLITPVSEELAVTALLGWKVATVTASNGDATLSRFPLEMGLRYTVAEHRLGIGLVRDLGISLSGSGVLSDVDADLESDLGYVLRYDYALSPTFMLGMRIKGLHYTAEGVSEKIDAGSVGLQLTGRI